MHTCKQTFLEICALASSLSFLSLSLSFRCCSLSSIRFTRLISISSNLCSLLFSRSLAASAFNSSTVGFTGLGGGSFTSYSSKNALGSSRYNIMSATAVWNFSYIFFGTFNGFGSFCKHNQLEFIIN